MYVTFCYHQVLKGYFYQSWKRIYISWLSVTIACNLYSIPHTQSPISMRLSMLLLIFSASHCPLNVTSGIVWTTKGIDCFNSTTRKAKIPLYKFPSSTFSRDWYCADFCKYISSIIKIQSREKKPFHKVFLTLLTHQHRLVEYYLTTTKKALEIFQVITCTLGVTHNVNVRHIESLMTNRWSPLPFIKASLIMFIQGFIVVVGGGI